MGIEVLDESGTGLDVRRAQRLAAFVLEQLRVHPQAELCITAVEEETIAELNARWMDKEGPTDVLAFPMDELRPGPMAGGADEDGEVDPALLGDVVLCPEVAAAQAKQAGHGTEDEMRLLCTHGILHLLGYDHAEPEEHKEMFGLQAEILASWREKHPTSR
jgi:probable rRNA maturation factor